MHTVRLRSFQIAEILVQHLIKRLVQRRCGMFAHAGFL